MKSLSRPLIALYFSSLSIGVAVAQQPASTPAPQPKVAEDQRPTGTAAAVNGQEIPEVAVWRALRQFNPAERQVARKEILGHLVENALIDQYLDALKITVAPAEVDKLVAELKDQLAKANKDYETELKSMMLTEAEFRSEVSAQMKWDKFLNQQGTDEALKAFYEKRPDIFDGTLVRASHILLTPGNDPKQQAAARETLNAIKQTISTEVAKTVAALPPNTEAADKAVARGKRMEDLFKLYAKQHSVCPSKENGGDLQFFPRVGAMVEPFAAAAFKLKPYEMSDVVESEFGYHLILCTAKNPGKVRPFEQVKDDVRSVYAMQLREAVIAQMQPRAKISYSGK